MSFFTHFTEQPLEHLQHFLQEEMAPEDWEYWFEHYSSCASCQDYVNQSPLSQNFIQEAEQLEKRWQSRFSSLSGSQNPPSFSTLWQRIRSQIWTAPFLRIFVRSHLLSEESLQIRAAGVSDRPYPNITLPETFSEGEDIQLTFEEDPLDRSLNIGLQGSTAQTRLKTKLKIFYHSGETETFSGQTIALGSMWSIPEKKAHAILGFEVHQH